MSFSEQDGFREKLVWRLETLNNKNKLIESFFSNYSKLAEEIKQTKNKQNSECAVDASMSTEVIRIRNEISDLYRIKSQNDQKLIDANSKLTDYEIKIKNINSQKLELEESYKQLCGKYAKMEVELQKTKTDNVNIQDERLALQTTCTSLTEQKLNLETERVQLLNKIRQLNDQKIDVMNAEIELAEKRKNYRIQELIASAIQDTSRDQQLNETLSKLPEYGHGDCLIADAVPYVKKEKFQCDENEVNDVCWLTGDMMATGGSERKVRLWRINPSEQHLLVNSLTGCNAAINRIDFERDKRCLLAASNDKTLRLWNIDNSRLTATLSGHENEVLSGKFYQTHGAVSGGADRIIKVWDLTSQRCSRSFFPASKVLDLIGKVEASPLIFISGHYDKKVRFWDGRTSEPMKVVSLESRITSLSVRGNELLCSTRDDTLSLIDIRNYSLLHLYSAEQYRTSSDTSRCVISPGGDYIAAGSANGAVFVWNKSSTSLEKKLIEKIESPILSVSWNPTGQGILTASKQKNVSYWN